MTFSIVARLGAGAEFGIALASSSAAVGARCVHARAGIGAVATQNVTDPRLGHAALDQLGAGASAEAALSGVLDATSHRDWRQLLVVGREGPPAVHTGDRALGVYGSARSIDAAAAGNLLSSAHVPQEMIRAWTVSNAPFGDRLLGALKAARDAGGEAGPLHAAALFIVRDVPWPIVDLRVDWCETDPIEALLRLWDIYRPQVDDYVTRALDPARAPSYQVPGDP
jgi:uncharacterized Ntn-hydrolase superfamily protein